MSIERKRERRPGNNTEGRNSLDQTRNEMQAPLTERTCARDSAVETLQKKIVHSSSKRQKENHRGVGGTSRAQHESKRGYEGALPDVKVS